MAEKERKTLLQDELSVPDRSMLGQVTHHGGFKVIDKLLEAALLSATADMVKLDPEKSDYDKLIAVRVQRSRNFNECIKLIRDSIDYHISAVQIQTQEENQDAVDAVAATFGIHAAPPKKNPPKGKQ